LLDSRRLISLIQAHTLFLEKGGARYTWNQDEKLRKEVELKRNSIDVAKQSLPELELELNAMEASLLNLAAEIQYREDKIKTLKTRQNQISSLRVSLTTEALTKVQMALTPNNILALMTVDEPSVNDVLVAKGVNTLLRIKDESGGSKANANYWRQFKSIVRDKDAFYHRLHHFFFNNESVLFAANTSVEGSLVTCSESVKSRSGNIIVEDAPPASILLNSLAEWLNVIFQSAVGHQDEYQLIQEESAERSLLERNNIDHDVMSCRICILRREIEELNSSIDFDLRILAQLKRRILLSKVMKHIAESGHTVLSWAFSSGNEKIVKQVVKGGAHTAIGEETIELCATIIQISFRRHQMMARKGGQKLQFEHKAQCLTMTMRISSLCRIVQRRFTSIRLPLLEALFNGHSELVDTLREMKNKDDFSLFQSVNLATRFCVPVPRVPRVGRSPLQDPNLVSMLIPCIHFQHENPKSCAFFASLRCAINLAEEHFVRERQTLDAKIKVRKATLLRRNRQMRQSSTAGHVKFIL
jgi:ankyrin repeat protein